MDDIFNIGIMMTKSQEALGDVVDVAASRTADDPKRLQTHSPTAQDAPICHIAINDPAMIRATYRGNRLGLEPTLPLKIAISTPKSPPAVPSHTAIVGSTAKFSI